LHNIRKVGTSIYVKVRRISPIILFDLFIFSFILSSKLSYKWVLRFHPDKCKVLSAGKQKTQQFKYTLCNTELQYSNKEKDIGVVIDNQLNYEDHMNEKINKSNSIMGLIRHTFTYIDAPTFLMLYKALVRPHLEYVNSVWNPYKKKHIIALENVQRRATKLILGFKDMTYENRLRKLPVFEDFRIFGTYDVFR
jgi:hypothetical protein